MGRLRKVAVAFAGAVAVGGYLAGGAEDEVVPVRSSVEPVTRVREIVAAPAVKDVKTQVASLKPVETDRRYDPSYCRNFRQAAEEEERSNDMSLSAHERFVAYWQAQHARSSLDSGVPFNNERFVGLAVEAFNEARKELDHDVFTPLELMDISERLHMSYMTVVDARGHTYAESALGTDYFEVRDFPDRYKPAALEQMAMLMRRSRDRIAVDVDSPDFRSFRQAGRGLFPGRWQNIAFDHIDPEHKAETLLIIKANFGGNSKQYAEALGATAEEKAEFIYQKEKVSLEAFLAKLGVSMREAAEFVRIYRGIQRRDMDEQVDAFERRSMTPC